MIWYSHLSKSFPQFVMTYIVKGFSVVNETEIDVFFFSLKFPCFLYNPTNVGSLISNSSSFSKHSSDIWNFSVYIMQKPSIQNFGLDGKESACNMGDLCLTPGLGRSPEGGHGNHSSILAWRIPWTEEPGRLQSMESQRVRHS